MPKAYTPGLRVTESAVVVKTRRLPTKGEVLVGAGDIVQADTVVARASLPGNLVTVKASQHLGIEPSELPVALKKKEGDEVEAGEVLAETSSFFGVFRSQCKAPVSGVVDHVSPLSGYIAIRRPPIPIEVDAYVPGRVTEVIPEEGVAIETRGAWVQGIFGVGGERRGALATAADGPDARMNLSRVNDAKGKVLIAGSTCTGEDLLAAASAGAVGVVVGGITDSELRRFVGYDIGIAITGHENVPLTLILTEGFGVLSMAERTWRLLSGLEGRQASINGATQIRAGVIRPEIIVALDQVEVRTCAAGSEEASVEQELVIGARVRVIREPHFGALGNVAALPPELRRIETEAQLRVAELRLDSGETVTVPRANLEIIQQA